MTPRLEPVGADGIDAVMAVMDRAFDARFGEAWSAAQVLGSLATGMAWARVARDGAPVGFTLCRQIGPDAELLLIGVDPAARRGGVGRALLATAAADANARGCAALFLEVRDGNAAALGLYRAAGCQVIGRRRDYYNGAGGLRFDAITLRADLNDLTGAV